MVVQVISLFGVLAIFLFLGWIFYKDLRIDWLDPKNDDVERAKDSISSQIGNLQNEKKKVVSKSKVIEYLSHLYRILEGKSK